MSTRTNIVIKDNYGELWFYRHSDGYPEGTMPTLQKFIKWVREGIIRDNAEQSAGWLILLGAVEYQTLPQNRFPEGHKKSYDRDDKAVEQALDFQPSDWKCGAYEPATGVHGDIEYLYIIDLRLQTISCYENWDDKGNPEGTPLFVDTKTESWKA